MNDNFIEEDNTVYEIDPNCQIGNVKGDKGRWKGQSFEGGCLPECMRNDRQSGRADARYGQKEGNCHRVADDRRQSQREENNSGRRGENNENRFREEDRDCSCERENLWPWKEEENHSCKNQKDKGHFNWCLLILLFWCFCQGK